jgi:hypothetical protein
MLSSLAAGLDVPQTLPGAHRSLHQAAKWYEHQQPATSSANVVVFAPNTRRIEENLISHAYSYEQPRSNRDYAGQLRALQQHYTTLDTNRSIIEVLEEEPALYTLLLEAVRPLHNAFGERRLIQIRVQFSDDDSLLKVAVQLPADFGDDPELALRSFDRDWWVDNCHRSGGALVFDYEIRDAV